MSVKFGIIYHGSKWNVEAPGEKRDSLPKNNSPLSASFIEIYGLFDLSIFQISMAADMGEAKWKAFNASWATAMMRWWQNVLNIQNENRFKSIFVCDSKDSSHVFYCMHANWFMWEKGGKELKKKVMNDSFNFHEHPINDE